MDVHADTTEQYVDFAAHAEDSPCFADWAHGAWPGTARSSAGWTPCRSRSGSRTWSSPRPAGTALPAPGPYAGLRDALLTDDGSIRRTILERATQTNEVGRLATLVPALAAVGG